MTAYNTGFFGRYTPVRAKTFDVSIVVPVKSTTLVAGDTYTFCFIPAFAVITALGAYFPQMDTNVTPLLTWDLGDSGSATRFLSASTGGQVAGGIVATGVPYRYSADDNLVLKVHASAATAAQGTVYLTVSYVLDGNPN